jgi:hypothetical protein
VTSPNRRAEFFALEASEYLAELEPLAARADTPDLERLVRGARALRGAALMAGLGTFARAAAGLEAVARQVRDHSLGWQPYARPAWREGLQTLRGLTSRATAWEAADDRHALGLADRLERIAAGQVTTPDAPAATPVSIHSTASSLTPGVRAFIARESELIAGSLLEASRALAPLPPSNALAAVLERMRSLRGLGAAGELSPLPELLDAMEATTRSLLSDPAPPPGVAGVFADASDSLVTMARSVAQDGRVQVPIGLDQVARRLLEAFTGEHDVVAIESLGYDDEPVIAERGTPPHALPMGDPLPIELVGVGDHLLIQADALDQPGSPAARDLRLFVLHRTLSTMPVHSGTGHFVAPLARAMRRAIGAATSGDDTPRLTTLLRDAGQFLVECGDGNDMTMLLQRRDALALQIGGEEVVGTVAPVSEQGVLAAPAPVPANDIVDAIDAGDVISIDALAPDDLDADIVAIASLAPDDDASDVVPIESLAPDADDERDVIPIAALAPDVEHTDYGPGRLERGFRRRDALMKDHGLDGPSLEALIGDGVVPMDDLLYRGARAMARAEEIRGQLSGILAEPKVELERLRPLLDELFDLVPLARDAA